MHELIMTRLLLISLFGALVLGSAANSAHADDDWRSFIETQPVSEVTITRSQSFAAEVISPNESQLASELNARILRIHTRPGAVVLQNQLLIELDCQDQQLHAERLIAQQRQNQASLDLAKLSLSRLKTLQNRDLATVSQLDEINTQIDQLEAQQGILSVEQAINARQIDRCRIKAPFDGAIVNHQVGEGQWVSVGTPLLNLVQTQDAEIRSQLPVSWLRSVSDIAEPSHLKAVFQALGIADQPVNLLRQAPNLEPNSRSVAVWFKADTNLPIGLSGQLTLTHPKRFLPTQVIVQRDGELGVFAVQQDQLRFLVLAHVQEGRPHPLPDDWADDLLIVTQGQQRLSRAHAQ